MATLRGEIKDKNDRPLHDCEIALLDEKFRELCLVKSDERGRFQIEAENRIYPYFYAVKNYGVDFLEFWGNNVDLTADFEMTVRIGKIEIYGMNCFQIKCPLPTLSVYFRPMSLTRHLRKEKAIAWSVGIVGPERIDEINILQATYEAMRQAISKLDPVPQVLLNDAVTIPGVAIPQVPIIKGDAKSVSIAAASILAKVTRDHMMEEYDKDYPEYGFAKHKGYGTPAHITALKEFGPTPIHRRTFITKFV